jgi:prevent-host-death family protein
MLVGIRELKAHLSEYIRRVEAGEVITITDHGRVAAVLSSPQGRLRIEQGIAEGWVTPPVRRAPLAPIKGFKATASVAQILDEDRGD